jgi:hypothetical protein
MAQMTGAALKNVAASQMPAVERLGVHAVQMPHAARQVRLRRLDEQVALVGHQAVGAANPAEALDRVGERVEEEVAIRIAEEDVLPRVAATGYMVQGRPGVGIAVRRVRVNSQAASRRETDLDLSKDAPWAQPATEHA